MNKKVQMSKNFKILHNKIHFCNSIKIKIKIKGFLEVKTKMQYLNQKLKIHFLKLIIFNKISFKVKTQKLHKIYLLNLQKNMVRISKKIQI